VSLGKVELQFVHHVIRVIGTPKRLLRDVIVDGASVWALYEIPGTDIRRQIIEWVEAR